MKRFSLAFIVVILGVILITVLPGRGQSSSATELTDLQLRRELKEEVRILREEVGQLRQRPAVLEPVRISSVVGTKFTAPCDGFIYVQCPNGVQSCMVLLPDAHFRFMTSGRVAENQSAMFPIRKDQVAQIESKDPRGGDAHIWFFALKLQ